LPIKISILANIGLNQAHAFKKRFLSSFAKVGAEDGLSLHSFFGYCQHMIELDNLQKLGLLMSMFYFQLHFDSNKM